MTPHRFEARGFTLIEMLIVMVIIGFSISIISLSITKSNTDQGAYKEAEILMQGMDFVGEQSVLNGEMMALFVSNRTSEEGTGKQWCYQWKRYRDGQWGDLPDDTLGEHCLPDTLQWDIMIEGRPYVYDPDIKPPKPLLVFAPSGETNALEMAIFERGSDEPAQRIETDLMGNVHWHNREDEEAQNAHN